MVLVNRLITFAITLPFLQVTKQARLYESYNKDPVSFENNNLRQGYDTNLETHENKERDSSFINLDDETGKSKLSSNVKVSYNGEVVYDNNPYRKTTIRTTTKRYRYKTTTSRPVRTYSTKKTTTKYYEENKQNTDYEEECVPACKGMKCKRYKCDKPKKKSCGTNGTPCKRNKTCKGRTCKKRTTWSNLWNYIIGNDIEDETESFCSQCEDDSFLFGSGFKIPGIKESICSICKPNICTDDYGDTYKCKKHEVRKIVKSNGDVSIDIGTSFFDTYYKLRDAVADPNALPKDFHF